MGEEGVKATSLKEFITRPAPVSCNTHSFKGSPSLSLGPSYRTLGPKLLFQKSIPFPHPLLLASFCHPLTPF